jgi:hypothetical protein
MNGLTHKVGMIRGKRSGFLNHSETAAEVKTGEPMMLRARVEP